MAIIKLVHLFAVFLWIGGLFTISRCLLAAPQMASVLKKIYTRAHVPLMLIAISVGVFLILWNDTNWKAPWLHMKLTFVFLLLLCDLYLGRTIYLCSKNGALKRVRLFKTVFLLATLFFLVILAAIFILKP